VTDVSIEFTLKHVYGLRITDISMERNGDSTRTLYTRKLNAQATCSSEP